MGLGVATLGPVFSDHAAQLGHHVQALLLAQILGAHDRLLVEQVAGAGLLLQVTLDHVYGPIHLLPSDLFGPLVGDGYSHRQHLLSSAVWRPSNAALAPRL